MRASSAPVRRLSTIAIVATGLGLIGTVAPLASGVTAASVQTPMAGIAPTPPALPVRGVARPASDSSRTSVAQASGTACAYGTPDGGYVAATSTGQVFTFGTATAHGTLAATTLAKPITGIAATSDGRGYWLVAAGGEVFGLGDAHVYPTSSQQLSAPVVGMAATADGKGYWLVASNGGISTYGDAKYYGSTYSTRLSKPIVGMAATPDGKGYWLVGSDGGIFSYGDARFYGSTGAIHLNKPIVGMAATPDAKGYWLVASDGGIFSYGDAKYHGSTGSLHVEAPIVGMAVTPDGDGYTLVGADGSTFPFGTATFQGTFAGGLYGPSVTAVAALPTRGAATPSVAVTTLPVIDYPQADYYYAGGRQWATASGASAQICQAAPQLTEAYHSLTELALESSDGSQIVEFISVVAEGNPQPFLWMTWWDNGVFKGSSGFVQVSKNLVEYLPLRVGSTASYAIEQGDGRWNYYYDGQMVGYFPDSLWGGAFTEVGQDQVFGEIATGAGPSTAQMGDGVFGRDPGSATVNGYQLFGADLSAGFSDEYYTSGSDYDLGSPTATSFRYGGPGAA